MENSTLNHSHKICCFGEVLLRYSPQFGQTWLNQASMPVYVGGAEANVSTALSKWGLATKYVSVLPDNQLSMEIKANLDAKNIDTSAFLFRGKRVGSYILPQGTDLKNSAVIYDREHSSFWGLKTGMIDWETVLKGCTWFHFSAISPALNLNVAAVCEEALQVAKRLKIRISVDLNYRAKLWQYGKNPVEIMPELVQYCDLVMGNIWAANKLLGISIDSEVERNIATKQDYLDHSIRTAKAIQAQFPACTSVANTFRFDLPSGEIQYFTTFFKDGVQVVSPEFLIASVVDKIGSGDCFMGGLIYGQSLGFSAQNTLNYATAAAFGKLQELGDATNQSVEDVIFNLERQQLVVIS